MDWSQVGKQSCGQTNQSFLENMNTASFRLKRRGTVRLVISAQFKILHLWGCGGVVVQPAQFHRHIGAHSGNMAQCPITGTQAGHSGLVDGESIISGLGASSLYVARTSLCPHTDDCLALSRFWLFVLFPKMKLELKYYCSDTLEEIHHVLQMHKCNGTDRDFQERS